MNPMAGAQQRLMQMEQQQQQQQQQQQYIQASIKGRAVTSIEEAKAAMIDLDGSIFVFPDVANKKIYTKQINLDGTASLNTYSLDAPVVGPVKSWEDVTASMQGEIDSLKEELRNVQSTIQSNANTPNAKRQSKSYGNDAADVRE